MKTTILILLFCFSNSAIAEAYKCIQSGRTTYSSAPCGDNAKVVLDQVTISDAPPRTIYQESKSVKQTPAQPEVAPVRVALPVQVVSPVVTCDSQEAEVEYVKKAMRAGYPASQSNYWHERYREAGYAYGLCWEKRKNGIGSK